MQQPERPEDVLAAALRRAGYGATDDHRWWENALKLATDALAELPEEWRLVKSDKPPPC